MHFELTTGEHVRTLYISEGSKDPFVSLNFVSTDARGLGLIELLLKRQEMTDDLVNIEKFKEDPSVLKQWMTLLITKPEHRFFTTSGEVLGHFQGRDVYGLKYNQSMACRREVEMYDKFYKHDLIQSFKNKNKALFSTGFIDDSGEMEYVPGISKYDLKLNRAEQKRVDAEGVSAKNPTRSYIAIDYDLSRAEVKQANYLIQWLLNCNYRYLLYPSAKFPIEPRFRLIFETKKELTPNLIKQYSNAIVKEIGVDPGDKSHEQKSRLFFLPLHLWNDIAKEYTFYNLTNKTIDELIEGKYLIQNPDDVNYTSVNVWVDNHELVERFDLNDKEIYDKFIKAFRKSRYWTEQMQADDYGSRFWNKIASIARGVKDGVISYETAQAILDLFASNDPNVSMRSYYMEENKGELDKQLVLLNDSGRYARTVPFEEYFRLVLIN